MLLTAFVQQPKLRRAPAALDFPRIFAVPIWCLSFSNRPFDTYLNLHLRIFDATPISRATWTRLTFDHIKVKIGLYKFTFVAASAHVAT